MNERRAVNLSRCRIGLVLVSAFLLLSVQGFGQQTSHRLHKHVPSVVSNGQADFVGSLPATQTVNMTIMLPLRNQTALESLLKDLYDPASPQYRQFLSVEEFTDRFGPTVQDYENVIQWAKNQGFAIKSASRNRVILDVRATVARVNVALNVSMNQYHDPKENRAFYSIDREPTINADITVDHIQGLNNYSIPQPMHKLRKNGAPIANVTGSGPGGSYLGSDMRAAYYGGSLLTGAGQCVGLLQFGGYRLSDVNMTFANAGQSYSVPINNVLLNGASGAAGSDDTEQVLDIVQAISMAPGLSQIRVYIGTPGNDATIFNTMATENVCKQLSVSWAWTPDDPWSDDSIFQEFAAQGQSVFVASGDFGAYDAAVSPYFYPAEDAYVTAVGGTHLETNYASGPWVTETAWNTPPYGSGGGISPDYIPIPSWQQVVAGSLPFRNVPDVSMEADNDNYFCNLGTCESGAGGTSFAAPRWAGFMALINQQATEAGTAPKGGIGFLNPTIYSIGAGANYTADFHDVTSGNNDTDNQPVWYNAITGYDLVTGWGSPNGQNFIDALAGPLASGFWLADSPASLSMTQGSSVTTTVSVSDAGGFSGSVSLAASGLPSGVTASFSPTTTTGTSVLTLTASSSATLGAATIKVTGTSGTLTSQTSVFLTVNSVPATPPPVGALGSINVGGTSSTTTETLTFTTAGTLGSISVLTKGIPNLDFTNAGGGTCTIGTAYAANATCTVKVTFSPKYAGIRYGAVVLADASGNSLAKLYLDGAGVGPQASFNPGSQVAVGTNFLYPEAAATVGDGSLYVTDFGSGTGVLYYEKFANGTYTQSNTNCTLKSPTGVAVDGSGTVYVADPGVPAVYKITIANGTCTEGSIGSGFGTPWGVAVDANGDVYVGDLGSSSISPAVYKETLQANGSYVQSTVGSGWAVPWALAVDPNGNVDIVDYALPGVFMETPSGGSYTQTPIGANWTAPSGIAIDGGGNIYVSDEGSFVYGGQQIPQAIYREALSEGSYIQSVIATGWVVPRGIAVDASGNVYVPDQTRGVFKVDLTDAPALGFANASTGVTSSDSPKTITVSNIGTAPLQFSSLAYPIDFPEAPGIPTDCSASTSLAASASCTLSIEFLPTTALGSNTSLALSESVNLATNNLNTTTPQGVAVSGTEVLPSGTIMLSVSSNPTAAGVPLTFTATISGRNGGPAPTGTVTLNNGSTAITGPLTLNSGVATYSTSSLAIGTYSISASYSGDANYLATNSNIVAESIVAAPGVSAFGNTNIGTQNIGSASGVIPLTITFNASETLGGISVLTEGAPNLDFTNAGGGTCSIGTAYAANTSCTVNATFRPRYPGARYGAVVLADNNGNVIGTGYLEGSGTGPQAVFLPGTLTSIGSGFSYPSGTAVDGAGNVYLADAANAAVYKETLANGAYTQSTLGSGLSQPYAVAVDGAGNVYIADAGTHAVYEEVATRGTYSQIVVGSGFMAPMGVAVDAVGNIYVADFGNGVTSGQVYLETPSSGTFTQSAIGSGFVSPHGVAVDPAGNVYVADSANGNGSAAVYKLTRASGTYNQTTIGVGWATPTGIAVDGNGNLFVTDDAYGLGDGFVVKEAVQPDGSYAQSTVLTATGAPFPGGISIDGKGNLYISDNYSGVVHRDDLADPPSLSFATTPFGSSSSDSPKTISVENAGNATLTFSGLTYAADFPEQPGNTTDCTPSTSLVRGASCTLSIDFTPASPHVQSTLLSENVSITTNSLNTVSTTQSLAVSGTEGASVAAVNISTAASVATVSTPVALSAIVKGQSGVAAPTGSVTFYSNGTALGTVPLNNGTATYSVTFTSVGSFLISAIYSGDQNYPSATSASATEQIIPASTFGTQNISSTNVQTFTIRFASRVTLGSIAVVTQGMPNLDFTNAGGGTCAVGTAYAAGATCTLKVVFRPLYSGTRHGAIVLGDNHGILIQTIFLQGTGVGPQLSFAQRNQFAIKQLSINLSSVSAYTVDDSGDLYVLSGNSGTSSLTKWTLSGGSYTSSIVPTSALTTPGGMAVDAAGSVYVTDTYTAQKTWNCRLLKETLVGGVYKESLIKTGQGCFRGWGVGVDGMGNIYITDFSNYQILKETLSGSSYTESVLPTGTLYGPGTVSVDGSGNLYFEDYENNVIQQIFLSRVFKMTPTGGNNYVQTTLESSLSDSYGGPVIDGNGSLYLAHEYRDATVGWTTNIVKLTPSGTGYTSSTLIPTGTFPNINGLALDGNQNLYIKTYINSTVVMNKVDVSDPPRISFASTNVGSKNGDSPQPVILTNVGNAPLTFAVSTAGTNPSISPNSFALDNSTTCPQIANSGAPGSLNANSSCNYSINFEPTQTGTINGSLVIADNALNAVAGNQTVPLSGTGNAQSQTVLLMRGPDGSPQLKWLPAGVNANAVGVGGAWIDSDGPTFVIGAAEFIQGTCTEVGPGHLTVAKDVLGAAWSFKVENVTLKNTQCPSSTVYQFYDAYAVWGSTQRDLVDPFILNYYWESGQFGGTISWNTEVAQISMTDPQLTESGSNAPLTVMNAPLTAVVSLTNPPDGALSYKWTIIGGGGAIVFANGQDTISSTTSSISIQEPNPTGSDVSFNLRAEVTEPLIVGSNTLEYGPTPAVLRATQLTCSPLPLTRGSSITCKVTAPSGSTYSNWTFSDGSNPPVHGSGTSNKWSGVMVTSGTVSVKVTTSNGLISTPSATVTVLNRKDLTFKAVNPTSVTGSSITCYGKPTQNVAIPPSSDPMGASCDQLPYTFTPAPPISDGGPNNGYQYVASVSDTYSPPGGGTVTTLFQYVVVPDLLSPTPFFNAQCGTYSASNSNGFIAGSQLLTNIVDHEVGSIASHWSEYVAAQNNPTNNIGAVLESTIGPPGMNVQTFFNTVTANGNAAQINIESAADHEPCPNDNPNEDSSQSCHYCGQINVSPYTSCGGAQPVPYCQ